MVGEGSVPGLGPSGEQRTPLPPKPIWVIKRDTHTHKKKIHVTQSLILAVRKTEARTSSCVLKRRFYHDSGLGEAPRPGELPLKRQRVSHSFHEEGPALPRGAGGPRGAEGPRAAPGAFRQAGENGSVGLRHRGCLRLHPDSGAWPRGI